jgi:hypothetical protein
MKAGTKGIIAFGNLAIIAPEETLDPWLCVPIFRWVCPYRRDVIHYFIDFIYMILLDTIHVNRIVVLRPC